MNITKEYLSRLQEFAKGSKDLLGPPEEGSLANTQQVLNTSFLKNTRTYLEKILNQINGNYEHGWYDSCAVMMRRMVETLIIETFESYKISDKIKNQSGDFIMLRDLIEKTLSESSWNIGRSARKALNNLKDIGDKSAHSRRFIAHRSDIEKAIDDFRDVVQELSILSGLKK